MTEADLARDTSVTRLPAAPGWYTANLPESWSYLSPSGGVLMTVAMRAMTAELGAPELRPVSATTLFCSPVPAGPLEIRVEILRRGGAAAQLRAALSSTMIPGPGLEVSATFARDREGPDVLDARMPDVPLPADAADFEEPARMGLRFPFIANVDSRLARGFRWWEPEWEAGDARFARWLRYKVAQRLPDGTLDPLSIPPIADTMPAALVHKLGPKHPRFHAPSLDLTVHFLEPTDREWLLVSTYCRRARAGYATAEAEIWDDTGKLVAFANQMMMLRKPPAR